MKYYAGIDVGTTNLKAALFTQEGTLAAYHSEPTPTVHPQKEWSEFEPYAIWNGVCDCLKKITSTVSSEDICSVGISSFGEAGFLADAAGMPLTNAIAWYDPRTKKQIEFVKKVFDEKKIYSITGQNASDKYGICKLLWFKDQCPEIYEKAEHWLSMEDWIIFCLTGRFATDYSIAARTMVFDIRKLCWSKEMLNGLSVKESLFSEAVPGGSQVGAVTAAAADLTGLSPHTVVSVGGHDHACASIAVDIFAEGVVLDSMGTAEVSMIAVSEPVLNEETRKNFYSIYPHCGKKLYRVITSNQSCGACIEWYLRTFGRGLARQAANTGESQYDFLLRLTENVTAENKKLFFFPFLRGSVEDRNLRGIFWGVDDTHDQGDFINAILNGICYELKKQIDGYSKLFHGSFRRVRVVGGLSKSERIMRRKAQIQQSAIEVPVSSEAACMGAALLGAVGAGEISFDDLGAIYQSGREYQSEHESRENDAYETYLKIRARVKEIYAEIEET